MDFCPQYRFIDNTGNRRRILSGTSFSVFALVTSFASTCQYGQRSTKDGHMKAATVGFVCDTHFVLAYRGELEASSSITCQGRVRSKGVRSDLILSLSGECIIACDSRTHYSLWTYTQHGRTPPLRFRHSRPFMATPVCVLITVGWVNARGSIYLMAQGQAHLID